MSDSLNRLAGEIGALGKSVIDLCDKKVSLEQETAALKARMEKLEGEKESLEIMLGVQQDGHPRTWVKKADYEALQARIADLERELKLAQDHMFVPVDTEIDRLRAENAALAAKLEAAERERDKAISHYKKENDFNEYLRSCNHEIAQLRADLAAERALCERLQGALEATVYYVNPSGASGQGIGIYPCGHGGPMGAKMCKRCTHKAVLDAIAATPAQAVEEARLRDAVVEAARNYMNESGIEESVNKAALLKIALAALAAAQGEGESLD